jgi:hypothetical protein
MLSLLGWSNSGFSLDLHTQRLFDIKYPPIYLIVHYDIKCYEINRNIINLSSLTLFYLFIEFIRKEFSKYPGILI